MIKIATAAGAAAFVLCSAAAFAPGKSDAAVTVFGSGFAEQCYNIAKDGGDVRAGIADCTQALNGGEMLAGRDLAGTYVNRGVLEMVASDYAGAESDFHKGIAIDPSLGEAYVNLGAVEIAQRQYGPGIADIDKGLALGPEEPEKAYYNRGLADESIGDVKTAYFDYSKAEQLKPNWEPPRTELARFSARPTS